MITPVKYRRKGSKQYQSDTNKLPRRETLLPNKTNDNPFGEIRSVASAVPSALKSYKKDILYYIRSSSQSQTADEGLKSTVRKGANRNNTVNSRLKNQKENDSTTKTKTTGNSRF